MKWFYDCQHREWIKSNSLLVNILISVKMIQLKVSGVTCTSWVKRAMLEKLTCLQQTPMLKIIADLVSCLYVWILFVSLHHIFITHLPHSVYDAKIKGEGKVLHFAASSLPVINSKQELQVQSQKNWWLTADLLAKSSKCLPIPITGLLSINWGS